MKKLMTVTFLSLAILSSSINAMEQGKAPSVTSKHNKDRGCVCSDCLKCLLGVVCYGGGIYGVYRAQGGNSFGELNGQQKAGVVGGLGLFGLGAGVVAVKVNQLLEWWNENSADHQD